MLLVCEEAHRYVPADQHRLRADPPRDRPDRQGGPQVRRLAVPGQPAAGRALGQQPGAVRHDHGAAAEQRARPAVRPPRLPDGFDWLIDALPALDTQEAIVVGDGVTVPMQIQFTALDRGAAAGEPDPGLQPGLGAGGPGRRFRRPRHQPLAPAAALTAGPGAAGQRRSARNRPSPCRCCRFLLDQPATRRLGASALLRPA